LTFLVGPALTALGLGLSLLQLVILKRVISSELIGGGIALIVIGLMATFYFWDDRRGVKIVPTNKRETDSEELTPDEFDRRFRDIEE